MSIPSDSVLMASAVSARAIAGLYGLTLLATMLMAIAAVVAWLLREQSAGARALVWRSAVVALLVLCIGRQAPLHWIAWVVPDILARPLVALGRVQVTASSAQTVRAALSVGDMSGAASVLLDSLVAVYLIGAVIALVPLLVAAKRMRRITAQRRAAENGHWNVLIDNVRRTLGIRRAVRVVLSSDVSVAIAWGVFRPVVVLPLSANTWTDEQRRMVLLHELSHVRSADWLFAIGARIAATLLWFNPAAWLMLRELREQTELACDENVLAAGVRRSDYAELLVMVAEQVSRNSRGVLVAPAFARTRGIRARLAAILDTTRELHPVTRNAAACAFALTLCVVVPVSTVQLAPTRSVLTTLMLDAQWESRAYAVLGLAQRADSVAVAQSAAESDPNPRVRAWAKYALALSPERTAAVADDLGVVIHKH